MVRYLPALFLSELRRHLRIRWSYRLNSVAWIVLWVVAFPLLMNTFDQVAANYGMERRQASLIGFLMWDWSMALLAATVGFISAEAREGTLEHLLLSPVSPILLFTLRSAAAMLALGVQTLILGTILSVLLQIPLSFSGSALLIMLLTLLGVWGFGVALAGLALVFKSVDSIVGIFSLLALVLTGAIVPLTELGIFYQLLKSLVPTTWGIDMLREVIISGATWKTFSTGAMVGFAAQSVIFVTLGALIFIYSFNRSRMHGELASY